MVPMINTAKEAAAVVTYSKFPPYGLRGQGSAFPAIGHGLTTPEYMKTANETILTIVQIETKQGVENVEEIAAVPGIGEFPVKFPSKHQIGIKLTQHVRLSLHRPQRSCPITPRLHPSQRRRTRFCGSYRQDCSSCAQAWQVGGPTGE